MENSHFIHELKSRAGKALGYSSLRIWTHEHPIIVTIIGLATVGTASSLVPALVEYFSK